MTRGLYRHVLLATGAAVLIVSQPAAAQAKQFDIPAQAAETALPMALADRALGIERPVPRLKRDDVECVLAVRAVAVDDVAGVSDRSSPWRRTNDRIVDAVAAREALISGGDTAGPHR